MIRSVVLSSMLLSAVLTAQAEQTVREHQFRAKGLQFDGLQSLSELRGRPVLIDYWGINCGPCIGVAVPASVKEQAELGDDLAVIFVESQGHSIEEVEQFAMKREWLGGLSYWTTERPMVMQGNSLPHAILLDVEGRVVLEGNPIVMAKQFETVLHEQLELRQRGPKELPKDLRKIWVDNANGRFAAAMSASKKLIDRGGDAEFVAQATGLFDRARAGADAAIERVGRMIDASALQRADAAIDGLERAVDGDQDLETRVKALRDRLDSDELAAERAAQKALAKLERLLREKGAEAVPVRTLTKFAKKHAGTKAAERAAHLASLIGE